MTDASPPGAPSPGVPSPGTLPAAATAMGEPVGAVFARPPRGGHGGASGAPRRSARGRPRRTRTRWRAAFFVLAGVAIVAGVSWTLLGDRVFIVRSVTVTGTHLVAPARVLAAADVRLGTPLLSVDAGAVTRRVEAISQVATATVTEDWPDHVVIAVTERVPVMAVRMAGGGYDLVDPTGVVVSYVKARPAPLPVFVTSLTGSALHGAPTVAAAADVLAELQPWLARQVAEVSSAPVPAGPQQVTLDLRDGKTVQWGSTDNAAQKNRELAILLPGQVRDVNVSAPGTVVTH
ncbi:MAG TPA: FtsQ-type POTRA domain-containing protein [Trebonia sp.]|nr:FtsQ-type POTRA domain-containing protein [Trebonia sp.]